jgi:signal transduction histidine kinase
MAFNEMAAQLRDERQALEDRVRELERTTGELHEAHDQLFRSERLASVGRLAAGVAHEIGNPLAAILGLVELVRGGGLAQEEQDEFLRRVEKETERIQKIIRDLLDFARQERETETEEASADLGEVVEDAVRLVAPQKDLRRVDIERRLDDEVPRVRGSADRLTQVVLNLLLNAADAIEGDGAIRVEVRTIDGAPTKVELVVADSGPGIAPEVLGELFEPFVTTKPTGEGTGLGLAVCHAIVERLGGTIRAENAPEGGARFVVVLPAAG